MGLELCYVLSIFNAMSSRPVIVISIICCQLYPAFKVVLLKCICFVRVNPRYWRFPCGDDLSYVRKHRFEPSSDDFYLDFNVADKAVDEKRWSFQTNPFEVGCARFF